MGGSKSQPKNGHFNAHFLASRRLMHTLPRTPQQAEAGRRAAPQMIQSEKVLEANRREEALRIADRRATYLREEALQQANHRRASSIVEEVDDVYRREESQPKAMRRASSIVAEEDDIDAHIFAAFAKADSDDHVD